MPEFSDFIVYVDESGDHGLDSIDPEHPIFVLAFCIFRKEAYSRSVVPSIQRLKFDFWGHDSIILHSHEIRKSRGPFRILFNQERRAAFLDAMTDVIDKAEFTVIASVINKERLKLQYAYPDNPYEISMTSCLERTYAYLKSYQSPETITHVVFERRGTREDNELELAFRRVCDGANRWGKLPSFEIVFADKRHNCAGLQLADLVAHPIGRHTLKPEQPNRAYDIVQKKFRRRSSNGKVEGWGLKTFP